MVTERIDEIISDKALSSFDQLSEKLNRSVTEFEKLIEKSVEANRVMGASKSIKELADATNKLEEAEKNLAKQQTELNAANQKLNDLYKQLEEKAKAMAKAQLDSAKAQGEAAKAMKETARQGDSIAQSLDEIKKSGEIASEIVSRFSSSLEDNIKKQLELRSELKKNKDEQKSLNKVIEEWGDAAGNQEERLTELAEKEAILKAELGVVNKLVRAQSNELASSAGSVNEYSQTLAILQLQYDNLSKADRESEQGQALIAAIQELDSAVKGFEESGGRFQRSVGNYAKGGGRFTQSLDILKKAFEENEKKLRDFTAAGDKSEAILEALRKESELLNKLLNNQATGFATLANEVKEGEKALQSLKNEGLEGSDAFKLLFSEVAKGKDELSQLRKELTTRGDGDLYFNAATDAAKGLVAAYGLAQTATAIFGDENEALQETLVKLQAAETALQSIEAIRAIFKKESALQTALNIGLQKIKIAQTRLQTAAESKNIVVKYASIVAQKALNAAVTLGAGPLGIMLGVISLLVISVAAFASSNREAARSLENLNVQLDVGLDLLNDELGAIRNINKERIAQAKARFATEEEIRDLTLKGQKQELAALLELERENKGAYDRSIETIKKYSRDKDSVSKEEYEAAEKIYDSFESLVRQRLDKESEINQSIANNQREFTLERIKDNENLLQIEIDNAAARSEVFSKITGDETKGYRNRIEAYKKYLVSQKQIIELARQQALLDPELSPSQRAVINNAANNKRIAIERQVGESIALIKKEQAEKDRLARLEILKNTIEDNARANDRIAENEKKTFDQRSSALYKAFEARRGLLLLQQEEELRVETLTATERVAIQTRYAGEINELTVQFGQQQLALVQANEEAITAAIEKENEKRANIISTGANKEIAAVNKARIDGQLSAQQAEKQRAKIEAEARVKEVGEAVRAEQAKVAATKEGTAERAAAEQSLSEKVVELGDAIIAAEESKRAAIVATVDLIREYSTSVLGLIQGAINASIDRQKNALQDQADQIDINKAREIDAINATAASAEEKAARIKLIEAQAANQKEQIERRQRQLDQRKAEFEKAQAIASIILNTAVSIAKALGNPFAIVANAALGAAQLAIAINTPIPRYAEGTLDHPGGAALVGDAWRSELAITPDGKLIKTPAVPTVMNLPEHTVVLPDFRQAMESGVTSGVDGYRELVNHKQYMREMTNEITGELKKTRREIRKKKPVILKGRMGWDIISSDDHGGNTYLNKNLRS